MNADVALLLGQALQAVSATAPGHPREHLLFDAARDLEIATDLVRARTTFLVEPGDRTILADLEAVPPTEAAARLGEMLSDSIDQSFQLAGAVRRAMYLCRAAGLPELAALAGRAEAAGYAALGMTVPGIVAVPQAREME